MELIRKVVFWSLIFVLCVWLAHPLLNLQISRDVVMALSPYASVTSALAVLALLVKP
jgi:hypothetical protein